ncbi:MAG: DUF389 domain-containing protein [Acidobacteriota bacterium]|nr:DUF389 domain-containing protein [Acidobacteriota bacterium]
MDRISNPIFGHWRNRFAASLGIEVERKFEIYRGLSETATLFDANYWLQILFAAGVATLGLVLNSPAVIIGAMLISPLMGPILSAGLALAAGDLILGFRSVVKLSISCLAAVGFAVLLVGLLPFKEMTDEIAARTQPNTLDLAVALFSGAIGSIATCKKAEGVVTSIPGVAIAVALMPPLCVAGYGIGLALSLNMAEGFRVASGGGLLFLTNLVAISFTAMLVFLALRIDASPVKEKIREWRLTNSETNWERTLLLRLHIPDKLRQIGGFPSRFFVILIPLLLILFPLSRSFSQLKQQYQQQRRENIVRRIANGSWQQGFAELPNGEQRSVLDQILISESNGKLTLALRVFTSTPYTATEKSEFAHLIAARMDRPLDSVEIQLLEIPTAAGMLAARAREEKTIEAPLTVAQLRANYWQSLQTALAGLKFPPAAQLVDYSVVTGGVESNRVIINYFAENDVTIDAQALITEDVRERLSDPTLAVIFQRLPVSFGPLNFLRHNAVLSAANLYLLSQVAKVLQAHPNCRVEIVTQHESTEAAELAQARANAVIEYLVAEAQLDRSYFTISPEHASGRNVLLKLQVASKP